MNEKPRDDHWWVPWHWKRRQWVAAIAIGGMLAVTAWLMLTLQLLWRWMGR